MSCLLSGRSCKGGTILGNHIPFVYTPDPAAVLEEVNRLKKKIAEETACAEDALVHGQRKRAALCYFSAWEAQKEVCGLVPTDENFLDLAERSWELSGFEDVGIEELAGKSLKSQAGQIWMDFFEKTRLPYYRKKAVMAGEIMPDDTDYTLDKNYLDRRIPELAELAVALESYDILENDDGEIMIAIHSLPQGDETQAVLFCDGGEHAILCKGPYRLIVCDFLHPQVRKKLPKKEAVLCYEDQNPSEEKGEYMARVVSHSRTSELAKILLHRLGKM